MSAKASHKAKKAEKNNDQLFPLFFKNLSSDNVEEFDAAAKKLADWLKVDKAYYAKARPIIIQLIETAHETVRRHSGYPWLPFHISRHSDAVRSWADPFVRLVQTVSPFFPLFSEPTLQMRLRALIQTLCEDVNDYLSQQPVVRRGSSADDVSTSTTCASQMTPISPIPAQRQQQALSTQPSPVISSPLVPVQSSSAISAPTASAQSLKKGLTVKLPGRPDIHLETIASPMLPFSPTAIANAAAAPSSARPVSISPTNATMASQPPRQKAKKRKIVPLDDDFIEADLNWYKDKHAGQFQVTSSVSEQPSPDVDASTVTPKVNTATTTAVTKGVQLVQSEQHPLAETVVINTTPLHVDPTPTPANKALQVPQASIGSSSPSMPSREVEHVRSRSPSIPLSDLSISKRRAPEQGPKAPGEADIATHPSPYSPMMLAPSIKRRRSPEGDVEETKPFVLPQAAPEMMSGPRGEILPSPLTAKKKKKKKRKGPPGFKILPILVDGELVAADEVSPAQGSAANVSEPMTTSVIPPVVASKTQLPITEVRPPMERIPSSAEPLLVSNPPGPSLKYVPAPVSKPEPSALVPSSEFTPPIADVAGPYATSTSIPRPEAVPAPTVATLPAMTSIQETPLPHPSIAVFKEMKEMVASPDSMEIDELEEPPVSAAIEESVQDTGAQETVLEDTLMREASHPREVSAPEIVLTENAAEVISNLETEEDKDVNVVMADARLLSKNDVQSAAESPLPGPPAEPLQANSVPSGAPMPFSITPAAVQDSTEVVDTSMSPFESTSARLLNLARGESSYTPANRPLELHFELSDEEIAQISRWNARAENTGDLSTSLCVSLVSYPLSQCTTTLAMESLSGSKDGLDLTKFGHPACWPKDGSLYVVLDAAGDRGSPDTFSVSPPFVAPLPDLIVDLGKRHVHAGKNTLCMFQYRDHSDRFFAVVLHHPTIAQLAELQAARDRKREWEAFLETLGTFNLPTPRLFVAPAVNGVSGS